MSAAGIGGWPFNPESELLINSFSDELRRLRKHAGLSQAVLAERAGLSTKAVSLLERGRQKPLLATINRLADALQLGGRDRSVLFFASSPTPSSGHDVPRYPDLLVGRNAEINRTVALLTTGSERLVTLTGPGGVGKTRVAVAAATAAQSHFAEDASWVSLPPNSTSPELVSTVAAALGLTASVAAARKRNASVDPVEVIGDLVSTRELLLVLDAAESALSAVAALCEALLERSTNLRVLVTSRERLHLSRELPIILLPLPYSSSPADLAAGRDAAAANRLFLVRAARVQHTELQPPRPLSPADAAAIATICRQVDGLPLAIEHAAARTAVLSVTDLASTMKQSLRFLYIPQSESSQSATAGPAAAPPPDVLREVVFGQSHRQLTRSERALLARLSVFPGQFTSAAVSAVCGNSSAEVFDALPSLITKSLVLRGDDLDGTPTFRLLRIVRECAEEQLTFDVECAEVRRRYAFYYRDLAARAARQLSGDHQDTWFFTLDSERDSLRRAFAWCLRHDTGAALEMVDSLWHWWHLRGYYREGRSLVTAALQGSSEAPARLRAPALTAAGTLALLQCDYTTAQANAQLGLDLYSAARDSAGVRSSLALLGSVALQRGEYTVAGQLHEQALVLANRAQDQQAVGTQLNSLSQVAWLRGHFNLADNRARQALEILSALEHPQGVIWALLNLGVAARYRHDVDNAQMFLTHSLERSEGLNYREGVAWSLNQLGVLSRLRGDYGLAQLQQVQSLEQHRQLSNHWRSASVLDELAAVALAQHDPERATAELEAAEQLRHEIGTPVPLAEQPAREATVTAARAQLGARFGELSLAGLPENVR